MKKYILVLFLSVFAFGCNPAPKNQVVIAKVNNYTITRQEFEQEFKDSVFSRIDTPESRIEFLNNLINRKVILQEAEAQNLDKQRNFLKLIEKFWEQSLLRVALEKKTQEIAGRVGASDKEIEETYKNMVKEGKTTKSYEQAYPEIKWLIIRAKESKLMTDWLQGLRKNAHIEINPNMLKDK